MSVEQVPLGQTGLKVGAVAFGCWRFAGHDVQTGDSLIRTALDAGMTLIDTADIYGFGEPRGFGGAESLLGEVLNASPDLRKRMVLTTKGGIDAVRPYDGSFEYLTTAMNNSLKRLGVESVDLYQIHRPDLTVSFAETARALNEMLSSGKTRAVGVSNFTVAQTRALQAYLDAPLATVQPEFSALQHDPVTDGTLDYAVETGATVLAWSPLAGGRIPTEDGSVQTVLDTIATARGISRTTAALAFTRSFGATVIPIIGTQTPARIQEAAEAAVLTLSGRETYNIIEAYRGENMP